MRNLRLTIACVVLLGILPAHATDAPTASAPNHAAENEFAQNHLAIVRAALDQHVVPRFDALRAAADRLPDAVTHVCETGDDGAREQLGTDLRDTVFAWAGVAYLRFGPMTVNARRERLSFWPDPRGIVMRQLRQILADKNSTVPTTLSKQSAAVQGLPALEALITDRDVPLGPGEVSAFRCALGSAIARNIQQIAQDIHLDWTKVGGWRDRMLQPGPANDAYGDPQQSASELLKSILTGLQLVADSEIKPQVDKKRDFAGPFAKANLSKGYFQAGVASIDQLYTVLGLEGRLPSDKDWVKNWAGGAWRTLRESDGAGGRVAGVPKHFAPPVRKVFDMLIGVRKLVVGEMAPASGLTVGFNELDGD